jgi:hypothetical protein
VAQLDNHAPYLTVRETFEFAHRCRSGGKHHSVGTKSGTVPGNTVPSSVGGHGSGVTTASSGQTTLNSEGFTENLTIKGLDLSVCADTFVGNESVRGVSGGQRRRVVSDLIDEGVLEEGTHHINISPTAFSFLRRLSVR